MLSAYRNDLAMAELNKEAALAAYAYTLSANPHEYTPEEISQHLERLESVGTSHAELEGAKSDIAENVSKIKQYVESLNSITAKRSSLKQDLNSPSEAKFNDFLNKLEFYLTSKLNALKTLSSQTTTEEGKQSIDRLITDTQQYLQQLNTEVPAIRAEYERSILDPQKLYLEYFNLAEKKSLTDEEQNKRDELEYLLKEYSAINGN